MNESLAPQRVTVPSRLKRKSHDGEMSKKISALTCYDFSMAQILDRAGIDVLLIGDSLGSVIQGLSTTLPVTLEEVIYHCRCVVRGTTRALAVGDMPFMSYQVSPEQALISAGRMIKEGGVSAVKLEGGLTMAETIKKIVSVDIPVMGHVGLTPQSVHRMGGYKVQGRGQAESKDALRAGTRERIIEDALAVEDAGAFAVVLEGVPEKLAQEITEQLKIPSIGIGAGIHCDGQILVVNDMLGLSLQAPPSFVKQFASLAKIIQDAAVQFAQETEQGVFPGPEHSFAEGNLKKTPSPKKTGKSPRGLRMV